MATWEWEREQERERELEQIKERARLEIEARLGQRWGTTLVVFGDFIAAARQVVIEALENFPYSSGDVVAVQSLGIRLQVLKQIENEGNAYIQNGAIAERKLFNNDSESEDENG